MKPIRKKVLLYGIVGVMSLIAILTLGFFFFAANPQADETAIRNLIVAFAQAENKGEAQALNALYTDPERATEDNRPHHRGFWSEIGPSVYTIQAIRMKSGREAEVETTRRNPSPVMMRSAACTFGVVKTKEGWRVRDYLCKPVSPTP